MVDTSGAPTTGVGAPIADDTKPWWQSKTIIGTGVALVATAVGAVFHKTISPTDQSTLIDLLVLTAQVVGGFLAIIGRTLASKNLK